ncbi:MAG: TolC family protein [Myxococcota bacterium]
MVRMLLMWTPFVLLLLAGVAPEAAAQFSAEEEANFSASRNAATSAPLPQDLLPGAQIVGDGQPLSLGEAVAMGIRNGLDVEVERYAPLIAETEKDGAWGAYNPRLFADALYDVAKSPNTSVINQASANRDRVQGGGVGFEQLVPYLGASLTAEYRSTSTKTRTTFQSLSAQFDSSFFVTARVPLARDLIWNTAWTNVKTSSLAYEQSEQAFQQSLMDIVESTVNRYWDLVAARDRVRVAQKSLQTARALLQQTETQYEVGVVSRVEVVESEAGVAERESDLIRDANIYRRAQDQLIDAVLGPQLAATTDVQLVPTEDPSVESDRTVNLAEAVRTAFLKRPELAQATNAIDQGEVALKFAKNQRLPQLDAEVRFGYVGVSGRQNPNLRSFSDPPQPIGNVQTAGPNNASEDFFSNDGSENYSARGIFSIPVPNTLGRKRVKQREFELRRAESRRKRSEQVIILEVRDAARTLLSSAQGIDAAERRRLSAEEQLRAERIRLEHGESTPFEVLQREEKLVEAENLKIVALQTYRAAEVALDRAQGTILEVHEVEVEGILERDR